MDAFVAATRFGIGARPGQLAAIEQAGARKWLLAQLDGPDPAVTARLAAFPPASAGILRLAELRAEDPAVRDAMKSDTRDAFVVEHAAHLEASVVSSMPFRERLVAFWSNVLSVSTERKEVTALAGAFERDVVRKGLDGAFGPMLLSSARHPAMLAYLDNAKSVGPDSMAGQRSGRGSNENYARELLELHTLGVGAYAQADVEALARLLTGWTVDVSRGSKPNGDADSGEFVYRAERHQPGAQTVAGVSYTDAEPALLDLARHPATARHLATRLARHFVADDPPASAVDALARAWTRSGGNLPEVHRALVALPDAWSAPLAKLKTPRDLVLSTAAALHRDATPVDGSVLLRSLKLLGQLPYRAPSPQGWPDRAESWIGPGALWARLEWAAEVGKRVPDLSVPRLAEDVLGPALTDATRAALTDAPSGQALALLISSPEFQRR